MKKAPVPCYLPMPGDNRAPSACSQLLQHAAHKGRRACLDTHRAAALAEPGARRYSKPEDGVFSVFLVECKQ